MPVKELIEALQKLPPEALDLHVCAIDNETGIHDGLSLPEVVNGSYWVGQRAEGGEHVLL